jgi:hypothetical protein
MATKSKKVTARSTFKFTPRYSKLPSIPDYTILLLSLVVLFAGPIIFIFAIDQLGHHCLLTWDSYLSAFALILLSIGILMIPEWQFGKVGE